MDLSENSGFSPKSSHQKIGFWIINHPFWGFPPIFWKHPYGDDGDDDDDDDDGDDDDDDDDAIIFVGMANNFLVVWLLWVVDPWPCGKFDWS